MRSFKYSDWIPHDFNNVVSFVTNFRNKSQLPATPVLSASIRTVRYHLGTLAKGSFIITLVKIPRIILTYIHSQLKGKVCLKRV